MYVLIVIKGFNTINTFKTYNTIKSRYQQTLHQAQSEVDTLHLSEVHTLHKVK